MRRTCERCSAALERDDLRCPVCALAAPVLPRPVDATTAAVIRCKVCRAVVSFSAEAQAPRCAYCGSVAEVETLEDPLEQAEAFLPFRLGPEQAQAALGAFLSKKKLFRPGDLSSASTVTLLRPVYWPAWVCNATALVSWAADSDAGSGRASWAPHAGQTSRSFRNLVIGASHGLSEKECAALSGRYDFGTADSAPKGPPGVLVEQFDLSRSGARERIQEALQKVCEAEASREVPGKRQRKLAAVPLLTGLDTARYGLPAYVLAYRYHRKLYRVVLHGQDAGCVLGKAPLSVWRILVAIASGLVGVAAIAAIIYLFSR